MSEKWYPAPWWVEKRGAVHQVQCKHRGEGSSFCITALNVWNDDASATAGLIAAAPELYAALDELATEAMKSMTSGVSNLAVAHEKARVALLKARGDGE